MTINIPSPRNFCLYEVTLDSLEVGISAFSNQINIIKYLQSGQEMIFLGFFVCLVLFPEKNTVDKREREEMSLGAGRAARFIMLLIV